MANTPDPRSIITPDAFSVDPPLLGTPLSPPGRRFWALILDGAVVLMITASTSNFWFVLPFIVGFFFISRAMQKGGGRFSRFRRFSFGCLGFMVLGMSGLVVAGTRFLNENNVEEIGQAFIENLDLEELSEASGLDLEELSAASGLDLDEISEATGLDLTFGEGTDEPTDETEALTPVEDLSLEAAMAEYSAWLALDPDERRRSRGRALQSRIGTEVAEDTISDLINRVAGLQEDLVNERDRADEAESGFGVWLRSKLDTISFGLGWWTMYFAILMPWMGGQTPGKRLLGIRVVRLDGQPVSWWHAFERAGGYAAGVATGLLGFVQIYWDPNRQGIHDKVAGTVVILDGAQRVPGQWEHVVAAENVRLAHEAGDTAAPDAPPPPTDPDPTPS